MFGVVKGEIPRAVGSDIGVIALGFTTDGSGVATLKASYGGAVTLAKATNTYTFTIPAWATTLAYTENQGQGTAVARTITLTKTAGTIAVAFGAAFNSGDYNFVLWFSMQPTLNA